MEASRLVAAKRLWRIVRIVYYMIRKGISKRKLMVDLHLMMKRGKIAGKKAIGSFMFRHHPAFICSSNDGHVASSSAFFAPQEYEFSCSNSPAYPSFPFHISRRKNRHYNGDDVASVERSREMLSLDVPASPLLAFSGVRQLRVTDSPFPVKDGAADEDCHVDRKAEEFIKMFHDQLRLQKRMAAIEARYQEMLMAGF